MSLSLPPARTGSFAGAAEMSLLGQPSPATPAAVPIPSDRRNSLRGLIIAYHLRNFAPPKTHSPPYLLSLCKSQRLLQNTANPFSRNRYRSSLPAGVSTLVAGV